MVIKASLPNQASINQNNYHSEGLVLRQVNSTLLEENDYRKEIQNQASFKC